MTTKYQSALMPALNVQPFVINVQFPALKKKMFNT